MEVKVNVNIEHGDVVAGASPRDVQAKCEKPTRSQKYRKTEPEEALKRGNVKFKAKDLQGAIEEYTLGLINCKALDSDKTRYNLLCNRSSAFIRQGLLRESIEDCEKAIEACPQLPRAWYKCGYTHLLLHQTSKAQECLQKSQQLDCKESNLSFLLEKCSKTLQQELLLTSCDKQDVHKQIMNQLQECIDQLIDDDSDADVEITLRRMMEVLEKEQNAKCFFDRCGGYRALFFYFTDSYCKMAGKVFRCLLQNEDMVEWPAHVVTRLIKIAIDNEASTAERVEAFSLLRYASTVQSMRDWTLIVPSYDATNTFSRSDDLVPFCVLLSKATEMQTWNLLPIEGALHLLCMIKSYSQTSELVHSLSSVYTHLLRCLIWMFQQANDLSGAFEELHDASIPSHIDKITTSEEALKFMDREKKRAFNQPVVQVKHTILEIFQSFTNKDKDCLRNEAFSRQPLGIEKIQVIPTNLLPNLIAILKELHLSSPLKTAPVLGMNGEPKTYSKKCFAANFAKNPFGDALVEGNDHDKSMLEICIDILLSCADNKNVAITLCSKNIGGILEELGKYVTESIVDKVLNLYRKLSLACPAFVSEVCSGDTNIVGLSGILSTNLPELQIKAMDCVLLKLTTCSGDDFAEFTRAKSGLDICYTILCRKRATCSGSFEDLKKYLGGEQMVLKATELARGVYLQSLERCRLQRKTRIPTGGAWDTFGREDILDMEDYLLNRQSSNNFVDNRSYHAESINEGVMEVRTISPASAKNVKKGFLSKQRVRRSAQGKAKLEKRMKDRTTTNCQPLTPPRALRSSEEKTEAIEGHVDIEEVDLKVQDSDDEDGLRVVWDSAPPEEVRKYRTAWANMDLRKKINWTQTSTEIIVNVKVPKGTKAKDLEISITPTRFLLKLKWYGRVFDGPLSRRCKASESWWVLEEEDGNSLTSTVQLVLPKDENHFWRALFEGGEMKSYYEVLQELVHADEPTTSYEDLPEDAKDLVDELRERQELAAEGLIDPDIFDDFRCVLSDGDGAK